MHRMGRLLGGVILVFSLALPVAGHAVVLTCGATVGPGGTIVLTADIGVCTNATNPALTIVGPVKLDMAGFTLSCGGPFPAPKGIVLEGVKAQLVNGTVDGCDGAVVVAGAGRHVVREVTVTGSPDTIHVLSDRNTVQKNTVPEGGSGFRVDGSRNLLTGNTADNTSGSGFLVNGALNRLQQNSAASNENEGFRIAGAGNHLTENTAELNQLAGFRIEGDKTLARDNLAVENEDDGFAIFGSDGRFVGNTARLNNSNGFVVTGSGHLLSRNAATDSMHAGFWVVFSTDSIFKENVATANGEEGIRVELGAIGHTLKGNEAFGNGLGSHDDLRDDNPRCDSNVWTLNAFGTANQDCIK